MASVLSEVIVDANDPRAVAHFWGEVLGWPVIDNEGGIYWASATGDYTERPLLVFVPVSEPKTVKNRLHIDVNPSGCDQPAELERLLALGAQRVDVGQGDVPWIVLADPEGNEFCLLARRIDP
jgi:predicted enzyme related to lactoylglutathione lyase